MRWPRPARASIFDPPACSRSMWRASKPVCCSSKWISSARARRLIPAQQYSPFEMGLGRLVQLEKGTFVGQSASTEGTRAGCRASDCRRDDRLGRSGSAVREAPVAAAGARDRVARGCARLPRTARRSGKATSTTWSPVLKKMIALATVERGSTEVGSQARNGSDRRSRPTSRRRDGHSHSVFQSCPGKQRRWPEVQHSSR